MKKCRAIQYSDQMVCKHCDTVWDANDPCPPPCLANRSILELVSDQAEWELGIELFERSVEKKKEQIRKGRNRHWWNWRIQVKLIK